MIGVSATSDTHRIPVVFNSTQIFPYVAVSKDALSNSPAEAADSSSHSACQNKHRSLAWVFKRNIRLSFALRSEAAQLSSHRARMDLRFGTFHSGRALALRTLPPPVASTGPATWTDVVIGT